jgi:hypothetical protein
VQGAKGDEGRAFFLEVLEKSTRFKVANAVVNKERFAFTLFAIVIYGHVLGMDKKKAQD